MDGRVWGEYVGDEQHENFVRGGCGENGKSVLAKKKQSTLRVMTGIHWLAYSMVLELASSAVDRAWDLDKVDEWENWGVDVENPDRDVAVIVDEEDKLVGKGKGMKLPPPKPKRSKKVPVIIGQKSVTDFFMSAENKRATNLAKVVQDDVTAAFTAQSGESSVPGLSQKQVVVNEPGVVCVSSVPAMSCEGVNVVERGIEVWGGSRSPGFGKNIKADMRKGEKRGARPNLKTQYDDRTLCREDSEAEGGINRPVESQISSPSSKTSIQKSRSVADIRKIFIYSE